MTPDQIKRLRNQTGLSQPRFAARLVEVDPHTSLDGNRVSRWERGSQGPNAHSIAALTALWLAEGYPVAANGQPAVLTTNNPGSSLGQPVVVIDGMANGAAEVSLLDLGDVPVSIREAAERAGYHEQDEEEANYTR